jgi:hypothetical protein
MPLPVFHRSHTASVGRRTGWVTGQAPFTGYAMWDLWSALSRFAPSQQPGKMIFALR